MNKILFMMAVLLCFTAPAYAAVDLSLTGFFKGYVFYGEQDDPVSGSPRAFDILRETEIHFRGETKLDNGLTIGFYNEADIDAADVFKNEKSYAYFSGGWGRVNFGKEDGATYLLQVAAPSADSNYDGIRQDISGFNGFGTYDYDNDLSTYYNKITYFTPIVSGFQAGVSYTPETDDLGSSLETSQAFAANISNEPGEYQSAWDAALRYKGKIGDVGLIAGGGYTFVGYDDLGPAGTQDDYTEWNIGLDTDWNNFGLGAAYTQTNLGLESGGSNARTWVVGADYTIDAYKLGATYLNHENGGVSNDADRYTAGVVYTYAPGLTLRGSVSYLEVDSAASGGNGTIFLAGTQINF